MIWQTINLVNPEGEKPCCMHQYQEHNLKLDMVVWEANKL